MVRCPRCGRSWHKDPMKCALEMMMERGRTYLKDCEEAEAWYQTECQRVKNTYPKQKWLAMWPRRIPVTPPYEEQDDEEFYYDRD